MIFLTIGTHEPFDRLVIAMDRVALSFPEIPIVAQISNSAYVIRNMKTFGFVSPAEFENLFNSADLIVSHAGIGTIITALEKSKPIIVMPRTALLKETRNKHQLATAQKYLELDLLHVANNEKELKSKITMFVNGDLKPSHQIGKFASPELIDSIKTFIGA